MQCETILNYSIESKLSLHKQIKSFYNQF